MSTIENPADREAETDDWGCNCPQCYQIRRITPDSSREATQEPRTASDGTPAAPDACAPVSGPLPRRIDADARLGRRVVARCAQGDYYDEGTVIAYTDKPTYVIQRSDGVKFSWLTSMVEDAPAPVDPDVDLIDSLAKAMWDAHADAAGYSEDDPWAYGDEGIRDEWRSDAREWIAAARSQGYRIEATR